MKRIYVLPLAVFLVLMIQGCGSGGSNSSGSTNVTIAVGPASTASPSMAPATAAPSFAAIRFTISAADMADPIVRTVPYTGSGTVQESFLIPSGADRHFLVELLDGGGVVLYRGEATASLLGSPVHLDITLSSVGNGNGNISGRVVNALNGAGVDGLTINLRAGINATSGSIVASTSTSSLGGVAGSYEFNSIPAGNYTGEVSGTGYFTGYFTILSVGGATTADQNTNVSPVLASGETRIILTWGATPSDLDSHLTGPTLGGTRFHVYYGNRTYLEGSTIYAILDRDVTSGYGPETTTIHVQIPGAYRFSVHNYSGEVALSNSGAQVRVYRSSGLVATFNVPLGQAGTVWSVFEMNGNTITPVNSMSNTIPLGPVRVAPDSLGPAGGISAATDAALLRDLPAKP